MLDVGFNTETKIHISFQTSKSLFGKCRWNSGIINGYVKSVADTLLQIHHRDAGPSELHVLVLEFLYARNGSQVLTDQRP